MTRFGGPKQACPRTSHSRPSPRSPPAFAGAGLQQMRQARADGVPPAVALADPASGNNSSFRAGITELGLPYAVGIMPTTTVWRPGEAPPGSSPVASPRATTRGPPTPRSGRGRRATRLRRDATHQPISVKALALELPTDAWQQIAPAFAGAGLAGGQQRSSDLALCPPAGARGARRRQAERARSRRVAADRVAGRRGRAGSLLALHAASRHLVRVPGRSDQAPPGLRRCRAGASSATISN